MKVADQELRMDVGNKVLMIVSLLALVAAVAFLFTHLAGFLGQLALGERDPAPAVMETVDQRIAPVGRVVVAAANSETEAAEPKPAGEVYQSVCAACHSTGAAGAPRLDDGDEWAQRLNEKGLDTLVSHAINGFQAMPARGGNPNLSDEEVTGTVSYMLAEAGLDVADEATVAVADEPVVEEEVAPAVEGDVDAGRDRYATCISCHGAEGQGMGIFPKIAGQSADYLADRLTTYRAGETVGPNSALMIPQAMSLSDEAIADLAAYIASF
jgi:cytochrome c5